MSRIGKKPITLPAGVTLTMDGETVRVKGAKGELSRTLPAGILVSQEENVVRIVVEAPELAAMWGTARALIANMVEGVTNGWSKSLELTGVGFRMEVKGKGLNMRLGFSHEIDYALPDGIEATIEKNVLTISGVDRQQVGQVASEIRALKKPEPYKGKGFRYTDEQIRRKVGKAAKGE